MQTLPEEQPALLSSGEHLPPLFQPWTLRSVTFRNRIMVSPMCQYSAVDGFATDWHLVHLGSRAVGGAALVLTEATAVESRGRITPEDLGIYRDEHIDMLACIARFIREQGAVPGIQLAHAGGKGSAYRPWSGSGILPIERGGWETVVPSTERFSNRDLPPKVLTRQEITEIVQIFQTAARRALNAGFRVIEIHAAHGFLLHEFLSPLSNYRDDNYGGELENRMRFLLETVDAIRQVWPEELPLFVRLSAHERIKGGLTIVDTIEIARVLKLHNVDLIDTSLGGNVTGNQIPVATGDQLLFGERIRREANIATAAVGCISTASQANRIIRDHQADLVALGRESLRDPYWPMHAANALHTNIDWPLPYTWGKL